MKQLTDHITFRNGAEVNNRIIQTPMVTNSGIHEEASEDTIRYYAARSRPAGMVVVEYTNISPNGGPSRSWAENISHHSMVTGRRSACHTDSCGNHLIRMRTAEYGPSMTKTA